MSGQKRGQVRGGGNRPHPGSAPAMGNAKGLVQVEMTDIGSDVGRPAQPDHGVHVGAVHIDLAAVLVYDPADFLNRFFKDSMRRRVRHHERG